jgi:hypothetical protein
VKTLAIYFDHDLVGKLRVGDDGELEVQGDADEVKSLLSHWKGRFPDNHQLLEHLAERLQSRLHAHFEDENAGETLHAGQD